MSALSKLPAELLLNILTRVDRQGQKAFRCVSRLSCASVTGVVFKDLCFDFDSGGIGGLVAISEHPHLAKHVRTIVLQRRNSLRKLDDFWAWQRATVYEHEPYGDDDERVEWDEGVMSQSEWNNMTDETRRTLFDDYNSDYAAITRRTSQLASATSSSIYHNHTHLAAAQTFDEATQTIRNFSKAIKRLSNVKEFFHNPSYCFDDWGERWRNIKFHRDGLVLQTGYEDDADTDALQLFIAVRAVILSESIRYVELCTRGHAFWSATHLRRLLDWDTNTITSWTPEDHVAVGIEDWIERIGGPVVACRYIESAARCLAVIESSFSRLETLECCIDTQGVESAEELVAVSEAVSRVLQRGTRLKRLKLALRESSWDLDQHTRLYHESSTPRGQRFPGSQQIRELLSASRALFGRIVASQALRGLHRLDLTVITVERHLCALLSQLHSLRHLALRHVSLLPAAGAWESIFQLIFASLRLESVDLVGLEDVVNRYPRLLLQPEAPVWNSSAVTREDYLRYEGFIVDFVLRRSVSLPPICPIAFLRQHGR
jgi:hypothetical protein